MKKLLMICAAALALSACVGPMAVTSVPAYNSTVDAVVAGIESEGYGFVGKSHDRRNERGHQVAHMEGDNTYSGWLPNELVNHDTYRFVDSAGNTMQFEVQFKAGVDHQSGAVYYNEVQVVGCSTSNRKDYDRLCGNRSPIRMLDTLQRDLTVKP